MLSSSTIADRRGLLAFVIGFVAVTAGAQFLAILALVPQLDIVSIVIFVPTVAALVLVVLFGKETKGRDLRDLDPDGHTFAATGV